MQHIVTAGTSRLLRHVQVAALAGMVPALRLEVFALQRQETGLTSLLVLLRDLLLKHPQPDTERACLAALVHAAAAAPDDAQVAFVGCMVTYLDATHCGSSRP